MANKAAKTQAARNTARLNQTLLVTLVVHALSLALRFLFRRRTFTTRSLVAYFLLSLPALLIQFWFERIARPTHDRQTGELKKPGEDLEAKGLTEWMWDVLYWTYICVVLVGLFGDWAWWFYTVVPLYSVYLAYTTFMGVKQSFGGGSGGADADAQGQGTGSKRQQKLEKRGGQRVQYR
ncbi:uncharacterized protein K452DRAFT_300656 [Aplosporella prunicola CBS 121167]|uniref:DUF788 domain protein n=1 Tax=Aplosporella prunicola CBS 121167 TaxID=1176127 RepID=A0A6A6B781_9PEZI|nr:uncharacterized protein K452DRAFT_300656 [Aplosporella prunicola CBS 121167]KAF2139094.1 hypothetical protein K452DRAFT_300656 [Aplosporella prunicola CBS 121167]